MQIGISAEEARQITKKNLRGPVIENYVSALTDEIKRKAAQATVRNSQAVQSQRNTCQPNQTRQETVQPPKANVSDTEARIQAAAEFVKSEREWVAIFKVAVELAGLSKVGTWPKGDSNEYIVAIESAALMGLIERAGSNVSRKREVVEAKAVQGSLFE